MSEPLGRHLPRGLALLREAGFRSVWKGDLVAGLTVTAYLIPQVMAYAGIAGLPPQAGLWTIAVTFLIYAVFGSSRHLSVGPESTTALLTAATLGPLAHGDATRYAALAVLLAAMVGVIALIAWLLRLGFVADLVSHPVLIGYLAGLAVIMVTSQLGKLTGLSLSGDTFIEQMRALVNALQTQTISWWSLSVGVFVLVLLILTVRRWPRIPMTLVAVVAATFAVWVLGLQDHGVKVVGEVSLTLPTINATLPVFSDVSLLLLPAIGVAVVAYADNVMTARAFAQRNEYRIDDNTELLALGSVNIGASLIGGFPVSSSASRSVLAESAGAKSQYTSIFASLFVVITALFLGRGLALFPLAALGGLVTYAAVRLVDFHEFTRMLRFRYREFALAICATLGVLVFDILYGILLAIGLSLIELLTRVAKPHTAVLGQVPSLAGWHDIADYPRAKQIPGLVLFRFDSPLFFANADLFTHDCRVAIREADPPCQWFVINMEGVVEVDITGLDALNELLDWCNERDVVLALTRVKFQIHELMDRHGVGERIGIARMFPTIPTAVDAYQQWADGHRRGTITP